MRALWRGIVGTIFWSYERGSWPYDVMVIAIVAFVLLTPRSWFHDQPQSAAEVLSSIHLLSFDADARTRTYRLDAKVFPPEKRATKSTPELERETHDILARTIEDLRDRTFQVMRIDPVRDSDGNIVDYDVTVRF